MPSKCDQPRECVWQYVYEYDCCTVELISFPFYSKAGVWHDSLHNCQDWFIHVNSDARHGEDACCGTSRHLTSLMKRYTRDMPVTSLYMWHDLFIDVTRLIHVRDIMIIHSYLWHDASNSCVWYDSFTIVAWLIYAGNRINFAQGKFTKSASWILQAVSCRFFGCNILVLVFPAFMDLLYFV